jgi:Domain of unknown function (DUF4349)
MPVHDPLGEERFAAIVAELRAAETPTPTELVERVGRRLQAAPVRVAPVRLRRSLRSVLVPALAVSALVAGVVLVARTGDVQTSTMEAAATGEASAPAATGAAPATTAAAAEPTAAALAEAKAPFGVAEVDDVVRQSSTTVPDTSNPARLQHQSASLRVALPTGDDVGEAATTVTRAIVSFGGYVTAVTYSSENASAGAQITAKVPIDRAQEAINRFSSLGRLAASNVQIDDLQGEADTLEQRVARLGLQIARLNARLADPNLTALQRAEAELQRGRARVRLADTKASVTRLERTAAMADFEIALITDTKRKAPAPGDTGLDAGDGWGVLRDAAGPAAYIAVVVAPLVALLIAALVARRLWRRRAERRLLA